MRRLISVLYSFILIAAVASSAWAESLPVGDSNAIWVESMYFRGKNPSSGEKLTDAKILELAERLKRLRMKYAFVFSGPFGSDGSLPHWASSRTARRTVKLLREYNPELTVLPWIGGMQGKSIFLDNPGWVVRALSSTRKLVASLGVGGVHLDFEHLSPDAGELLKEHNLKADPKGYSEFGAHVLRFHAKLREILPKAFISTALGPTAPEVKLWKRGATLYELEQLQRFTNQIAFMFYDTAIQDKDIYRKGIIKQLEDIKSARRKQERRSTQYLLGVGTFVNEPRLHKWRNLELEGLKPHFAALRSALTAVKSKGNLIDGIAVFCDWETDQSEADTIRREWLDKL